MYDEELIIEYFEDVFTNNKEELARFEKEIGIGNYLEFDEWVKKQENSGKIDNNSVENKDEFEENF